MIDPFSSQDLGTVKVRVRRAATSRYLTPTDVEDIAGDVLLAAVRTAPAAGVSIAAAAIGNTARPRYITRKVKEAQPYATSYRFGVTSRVNDLDIEEYDSKVMRDSGYFGAASDEEIEIRDLVRRLPTAHAHAFTLCGEYGYTLEEAAEILGVSRATVDRNLKRARAALQLALVTH